MRSKISRCRISLLWIILAVLLEGCGEAAAPGASETPTETAPPTITFAPSKTDTPTPFLTPTETPTETQTFTPTTAYNIPGVYQLYQCVTFQPFPDDLHIVLNFCIQTVKVNDDYSMHFNVIWKYTYTETRNGTPRYGPGILKTGFTNTVLIDNLKNEYKPVDAGGAAINADIITSGSSIAGWYRFDPPQPGATSFRLLDLDLHIAIENIVLVQRTGTDTPTLTPTSLKDTPYNEPGIYYFYRCIAYPPSGRLVGADSVQLCLISVKVNEDRTMKFNMIWKVITSQPVVKDADVENENIILMDDFEKEYRYTAAGGCAAEDKPMYKSDNCSGWYLFPPVQPGATVFRFVDFSNLIAFEGIVLIPKSE